MVSKKHKSVLSTKLHIIIPTETCNLKCLYCYAKDSEKDNGHMKKDVADKIVHFILKCNDDENYVQFTGGEPLLNFEIIEYIVTKIKERDTNNKKINFVLFSNLTLMNDKILDFLIKNEFYIFTSLDGPKDIHDFNRPSKKGLSSYDSTKRWIKTIQEKCPGKINALPVITKKSLDKYKEIIDEYERLGLNYIKLRQLNNLGNSKKNYSKIRYSEQEYINFWDKSLKYILENKKDMIEGNCETVAKKLLNIPMPHFSPPCNADDYQLTYDCNGDIFTCDEGRQYNVFRLGNVFKSSFEDIKKATAKFKKTFLADNDACLGCQINEFCGICPVIEHSKKEKEGKYSDKCGIVKKMFDTTQDLIKNNDTKEIILSWANDDR